MANVRLSAAQKRTLALLAEHGFLELRRGRSFRRYMVKGTNTGPHYRTITALARMGLVAVWNESISRRRARLTQRGRETLVRRMIARLAR